MKFTLAIGALSTACVTAFAPAAFVAPSAARAVSQSQLNA